MLPPTEKAINCSFRKKEAEGHHGRGLEKWEVRQCEWVGCEERMGTDPWIARTLSGTLAFLLSCSVLCGVGEWLVQHFRGFV